MYGLEMNGMTERSSDDLGGHCLLQLLELLLGLAHSLSTCVCVGLDQLRNNASLNVEDSLTTSGMEEIHRGSNSKILSLSLFFFFYYLVK